MSNSFKLQVPQPCQEDWNNFKITEKGGFCTTCTKEVIDFTKLTDQEIKEYFISAKASKVCGKFKESQLNRNIAPGTGNESFALKYASMAIGLTAFFSSTSLPAQTDSVEAPYLVSPANQYHVIKMGKVMMKEPERDSISGFVLDGESNEPLPGVQVLIKNSALEAATNTEGYFSIPINSEDFDFQKTLIISYIGYQTEEIIIKSLQGNDGRIRLKLSPALTGEVVVVGGAFRKSNLFERVWWKMKGLFD